MELTKEEVKFIIDNRIWVSWKEILGRFKEAFRKSWRYKLWSISKAVFIISACLTAFVLISLAFDYSHTGEEIPVSGEHVISIDGWSVYIDDEPVIRYEEMPWQWNTFPFFAIALLITGAFLFINWCVSIKKPISVTQIIGKMSSKEIAMECWEQSGELPPIPPSKKGRSNHENLL